MRLPQIQGIKWWVQYIQDCESSLPTQLQRDLTDILTRSPDSDSDDEGLDQHITKNIELFNHDDKYVKNKDGIYCLEGDQNKVHPLQTKIVERKKRKSLLAKDKFEINLI